MIMGMRTMMVIMVLTLGKPLDLFILPWSRPPAASPGLVSTWEVVVIMMVERVMVRMNKIYMRFLLM